MATHTNLKRPPIKEIILTISFVENIELEKLDTFRKLPEVANRFPFVGLNFNAQFQVSTQTSPQARMQSDGFVLRASQSPTTLLQTRRGSIAFHLVKEYSDYANLVKQFEEYWTLFEQLCGPLTVNNLKVRYINFIEIAIDERIEELLAIHLQHPFEEQVKNCLTQQRFNSLKNPAIAVTVVCTTSKIDSKDGVVLDIILNKTIQQQPTEGFDFHQFDDIREIKNDLFFRSITAKAKQKYNQ